MIANKVALFAQKKIILGKLDMEKQPSRIIAKFLIRFISWFILFSNNSACNSLFTLQSQAWIKDEPGQSIPPIWACSHCWSQSRIKEEASHVNQKQLLHPIKVGKAEYILPSPFPKSTCEITLVCCCCSTVSINSIFIYSGKKKHHLFNIRKFLHCRVLSVFQ